MWLRRNDDEACLCAAVVGRGLWEVVERWHRLRPGWRTALTAIRAGTWCKAATDAGDATELLEQGTCAVHRLCACASASDPAAVAVELHRVGRLATVGGRGRRCGKQLPSRAGTVRRLQSRQCLQRPLGVARTEVRGSSVDACLPSRPHVGEPVQVGRATHGMPAQLGSCVRCVKT